MPEANAMKLKRVSYAEFRKKGGYAVFDKLLAEKVNAHWIARGKGDVPSTSTFRSMRQSSTSRISRN